MLANSRLETSRVVITGSRCVSALSPKISNNGYAPPSADVRCSGTKPALCSTLWGAFLDHEKY